MRELRGCDLRSNRGSITVSLILIALTLVIIVAGLRWMNRPREMASETTTPTPAPQASSQLETHAFYIAQTALDRTVKALVANPTWREGFEKVAFEDGIYNVKILAGSDPFGPTGDTPANYVRILASSEIDGVRKEVEAIWVDAMAAFRNTYTAGNRIDLRSHDASRTVVLGRVHNNSWNGGRVDVDDGVTVYGDVTSLGDVSLGSGDRPESAKVFGSVWGSQIELSQTAEIRRFDNLSEWNEGIDLNGDGDTADEGLSADPTRVSATSSVIVDRRSLANGDVDLRIAGGSVGVSVGDPGIGAIVDPRPNFTTYYELVTGSASYPPVRGHVATPISGDGDGHYFDSAARFVMWLRTQNRPNVHCWRCAGDGRIDPGNTSECPNCEASGREPAIEIFGVFYIDDTTLDLSDLGHNLIVHGTIVVADGDPYDWPSKTVDTPGGEQTVEHFPERGQFVLKGQSRMNFMQTYRSQVERGAYRWRKQRLFSGENTQTIALREPANTDHMRHFPGIIAATAIVIEPRRAGFAYLPGDIGDEALTVLQGVLYAEERVWIHGRGGWNGEPLVFDENAPLGTDDSLDESALNVDLNGDGDVFDNVELSAVSEVPVVPLSRDAYAVDVNNDGVLGKVTIGTDYVRFFNDNGYVCPILIYHEGLVLGRDIHSCDETLVVFDPLIAESGAPYGFELTFGSAPYPGLVYWQERRVP